VTRIARLALLIVFLAPLLSVAAGCETDTSPAQMGDNPPPPPNRTPTGLRHRPNTGVQMMSDELTPEEAAKLGAGEKPQDSEASEKESAEGAEAGSVEE
jgi:hypothetical protein